MRKVLSNPMSHLRMQDFTVFELGHWKKKCGLSNLPFDQAVCQKAIREQKQEKAGTQSFWKLVIGFSSEVALGKYTLPT
jgi:hypothetical protein